VYQLFTAPAGLVRVCELVSCQRATCNFTPSIVGGNPVFSLCEKESAQLEENKTILSECVNVFVLSTVFALFSRIAFLPVSNY